ncbi:hypothetical protein ACFS07_26860 [Undibacterium arcticum]
MYSSIELYCNNLLQRLTKEEDELLPLAQRVISSDEWFAIGAQFLSLDAENKARRQSVGAVRRPSASIPVFAFNPAACQPANLASVFFATKCPRHARYANRF